MSPTHPPDCPELPATLLWIHGEGDEAALHHAAGCLVCSSAIADAEQVFAALPPRAAASEESSARVIALPAAGRRTQAAARPASRPFAAVAVGGFAVAAALLLILRLVLPAGPGDARPSESPTELAASPEPSPNEPAVADSPPDVQVAARAVDAPAVMDDAFDTLAEDLDALEASLASL